MRAAIPETLPLRLTDCLAPFWSVLPPEHGEPVNWSKIPFAAIAANGLGDPAWERALLAAVDRYLDAVAALGYTAITCDDLAHLVVHPWYPGPLLRLLDRWKRVYREVFARASARGLSIYVTSDYTFFNEAIDAHLRETGHSEEEFFVATVQTALVDWPEIDGLVLRVGESDGVDVENAFLSRLSMHHPAQANRLLQRLLPLFERNGKTLLFRTWTLGAYPIGDLIWNQKTWDATFSGIDSPALIVSLKYGDADFFRFLPLNPLFFRGPQRKLIELQCRREYEGMGEFPAFVGWLYEPYLRQLRDGGADLAGVFAIQGGGWAPFRRLPFAGAGSFWNELNTAVVAHLAQGRSVEESVRAFCRERGIADADAFLRFLRLADDAVERGLYIREFAERARYFRRVRIPPLVWVFWHHVSSGGLVSLLYRALVRNPAQAAADGHAAVRQVEQMAGLAPALGLDEAPLRFQLDTFRLLALHREVLLGVGTAKTRRRIAELLPAYSLRYPDGYEFDGVAAPRMGLPEWPARWLVRALLRSQHGYRWPDRLHLSHPASRLLRHASRRLKGALPRFAGRQGMTPDMLLR
jgi:hypothetical protein